jgi:hypothetical protein
MKLIRERNPGINDPNHILVGSTVIFPPDLPYRKQPDAGIPRPAQEDQ